MSDTQSTDQASRAAATRSRLDEIEIELQSLSHSALTSIVSSPAPRKAHERRAEWVHRDTETRSALAQANEDRRAELLREKLELRGQLPPEGMASGQGLVMYRGPGSYISASNFEPEPQVHVPVDEWDWSEP